MVKRILLYFIVIFSFVIVLVSGFYISVSMIYKTGFTYGTWINGIYCTNKSIEEVNNELVKIYPYKDILVSSSMFEDEIVYISDVDFSVDYTKALENLQNNQNPFYWYKNLSKDYINSYIYPEITFNQDKLKDAVSELKIFDYYNPQNDYRIEVVKTDSGFELIDERRKCIVYEDVYFLFENAIRNNSDVYISDEYFTDYIINRTKLDELKLWRKVSDYIKHRFTIDMGAEVIEIDSKLLSDFLLYEDGEFILDENKQLSYSDERILEYLENLLTPYNTYRKPRDYITFNGEEKHIETSLYGTEINVAKEKEYILNAIKNKTEEVYIPTYIHKGYVRGLNDIGSEYIEVDLTNQIMMYIKDNEIVLQTDVVTGKPSTGCATPEAICFIYKKVRDTVLFGEDYRSPVDFWMAIYGAIGIHDSSWQRAYGGKRYLTYGSHGCINTPYDAISELFDMVEVGIPVILYK